MYACPSCGSTPLPMSITGGLVRYSCEDCNIYLLEALEAQVNPSDLLAVFRQVMGKGAKHDREPQ